MTDSKQLIERLKRADKNERRGWGSAYENAPIPTLWLEAASALEAKDREISELREALKPFAEAETEAEAINADGVCLWEQTASGNIIFGDLRTARAKLEWSGA